MIGLNYFIGNYGIGQQEIAKKLNISNGWVSKWLKDIKNLTKEQEEKISQLLNIDSSLLREDIDFIIINPEHEKYKILCQSIKQMRLKKLHREKEEAEKKIKEIEMMLV